MCFPSFHICATSSLKPRFDLSGLRNRGKNLLPSPPVNLNASSGARQERAHGRSPRYFTVPSCRKFTFQQSTPQIQCLIPPTSCGQGYALWADPPIASAISNHSSRSTADFNIRTLYRIICVFFHSSVIYKERAFFKRNLKRIK